MYDPQGVDANHEWIEIYNPSTSEIDITGWKFHDGSNHTIFIPPANGGRGSLKIGPGEFAILAGDAATFISEYPNFSGTVADTVMSLGQQSDRIYTLSLISEGQGMDQMEYRKEDGGSGDGYSLQKMDNKWSAGIPTPGEVNTALQLPTSGAENSTTTQSIPKTNDQPSAHYSHVQISYFTPPEPFKVSAGRDRLTTPGNTLEFVAETNNTTKRRSHFVWSFGDGDIKEGQIVTHVYEHPGNYVVVLNADSSGEKSVSRTNVQVVTPSIVILNADSEKIELKNNTTVETNLFGYRLWVEEDFFDFPQDTILKKNERLSFDSSITNLHPSNITEVHLTLSNNDQNVAVPNQITDLSIASTTLQVKEINLNDVPEINPPTGYFLEESKIIQTTTSQEMKEGNFIDKKADNSNADITAATIKAFSQNETEHRWKNFFNIFSEFLFGR